jgi:hypothetical protein
VGEPGTDIGVGDVGLMLSDARIIIQNQPSFFLEKERRMTYG